MAKKLVGVIGLGIMGGCFAANLAADGWRVLGYDIDAGRRRMMARRGIEASDDLKVVIEGADTLISSLPTPAALHSTAESIVHARVAPRVIIETSTLRIGDKVEAERTLRKARHTLLDCPISGTGAQARDKDLVVYASGDSKAIRRLRPLFLGFARAVHDLGGLGNGSRMEYVANLLVAINYVAAASAMVLGIKAGLDPKQIVEVVGKGAGNSRILELRGPMMAANHYADATMRISTWHKD